ncbi:MAG: branched-chain amino acid ABC transporter substrate-binding protein, partial [Alphaproteobacteria bacterium]|nr:branched-chain amino acid ABC transporter substrate-binding protein [Alphaproteobacteria bacterium]
PPPAPQGGGRFAFIFSLFLLTQPAYADIIIGVAGPMSGQYQAFGAQMKAGAQAAIDDINAHGGISGELLALNVADDECDVRKAEAVAHQFVSAGVQVVIGHFCSNPALAASKIYETAGIIMIAPTASLPLLADGAGWNVVRLASRDDAQADAAAAHIQALQAGAKIGVVDDGTSPNAALTKRFLAALTQKPVLSSQFRADGSDFAQVIGKFAAAKLDAIYCACAATDAGNFVNGLRKAGSDARFYGPDSLISDAFWERSGEAGNGTEASFTVDPQAAPEARAAIEVLKAQGASADGATLPSYAAVQLFAAGAVENGTGRAKAMADWVKSGVIIHTVLGSLKFDKNGEVQPPRFVWYEWRAGTYSASTPTP